MSTSELFLLMSLNEILLLRNTWQIVYTSELLIKTQSICFKQLLFKTSWNSIKNLKQPNETFNKFFEIFTELYEKYSPIRKITLKPKRTPSTWITSGIANSPKQKQKEENDRNEENHKAYKNLFETIKRKSKKRFYLEKLIKFQGDVKKTWYITKELIGNGKINKFSLSFKIATDKTEILGETNIANEFNNFLTM